MELLEYLIHSWDVQAQAFRLGQHLFEIKVEDIYFLTHLSMRGAPISFLGGRRGRGTFKDEISIHYIPQAHPTRDGKINIKHATQFSLRILIFIISRFVGSCTLHVANISYINYVLECIEPTILNCSEGVLVNMKEQLIKSRSGLLKFCSYDLISIYFSLEWIPLL